MKRLLKVLGLAVLLFCSYASSAMATVYECDAVQVTEWRSAQRLTPLSDEVLPERGHVILFNDETGDAWITKHGYVYKYDKLFFDPLPFKILLRPDNPSKWLLAVVDGKGNDRDTGSTFRLSIGAEDNGTKDFFFYSTRMATILTGGCRIHKGDIPEIKR